MRTTTIICDFCNKSFDRSIYEVRRSRKRDLKNYCSARCSGKARSAEPRIEHESNAICAFCGVDFYKKPSSKAGATHGFYFCCREHKDLAQRLGGIEAIQPDHYGKGNGLYDYRARAFAELPHRCSRCDWDEVPEVLRVHHRDRDRTNNEIANLELLCGTCHDLTHYETRTGRWLRAKQALSQLELQAHVIRRGTSTHGSRAYCG